MTRYDGTYRQKIKLKRLLSKQFDKEYKRKRAQSQANRRRKIKQQQAAETAISASIPSSTTSTKTDLRRKEGQRRRRLHVSKLNNEILELRGTVRQLTKENGNLKRSRSLTSPRPSPTKLLLNNMSPSAKKRTVLRLKDQKENLPRGSALDLRRKFGINLSNQSQPKKTSPSSLQTEIEQFFNRDDISKPCPDKKKHVDNHQIRYRLNHLTVLHQRFELETSIDIDYDTFCHQVPIYIKKPNHDSWGTCLCIICLNPQMKFEKIQYLKPKNPNVKTALEGVSCDISELVKDNDVKEVFKQKLMKLNEENFTVTFSEWQKKKLPNCAAPVSTKVTTTQTIQDFLQNCIREIDVNLSQSSDCLENSSFSFIVFLLF
jgi:hypothetical protein